MVLLDSFIDGGGRLETSNIMKYDSFLLLRLKVQVGGK